MQHKTCTTDTFYILYNLYGLPLVFKDSYHHTKKPMYFFLNQVIQWCKIPCANQRQAVHLSELCPHLCPGRLRGTPHAHRICWR
uniref:Uncharacterized protein n=1 Tax=Malurus cyaneus samueli TaxID=2593467 RepID=A0A8C5T5E5_9PASS